MKTLKLIIGIVSIVLFAVITLQSCAVGIGNTLTDSGEVSGSAGFILAVFLLIAGIVGIVTRKSRVGGIVSAAFYFLGGVVGIANYGTYSDLRIWSILSFIFAALFFVGSVLNKAGKGNPPSAPEI